MATQYKEADAIKKALQIQRYRPIALESLNTDGSIRLPQTPQDPIDTALLAFTHEPKWIEIARQLSFLKESKGFKSVYIRRNNPTWIEIVVIHWWGKNGSLSKNTFLKERDFLYNILKSLRPLLGAYQMHPDYKAKLSQFQKDITNDPISNNTLSSFIELALLMDDMTNFDNATFFTLAYGGFDSELSIGLRADGFNELTKYEWGEGVTMSVAGWDIPNRQIVGVATNVDLKQLDQDIKYLLSSGK